MKDGVNDTPLLFVFSSRSRHTRLQGDWSSDVCSSDLFLPRLRKSRRRRKQKGFELARQIEPAFLFVARGFALAGRFGCGLGSFGFGFGGRKSGASFCGELGDDEVVGVAKERGEVSRGDGGGGVESHPTSPGEGRCRDDGRPAG